MRRLLTIAMVLASARAALAGPAPSDLISRPLVLGEGAVAADLVLEVNAAPSLLGQPTAIAPDVWYGLQRDLTVGVIHSDQSLDRIPKFWQPGTAICIHHNSILCTGTYHGSSLDVLYGILAGQFAVAAHLRFLFRDLDPVMAAATVGATLRWQRGRYSIYSGPYVQFGLSNQLVGNRSELNLPLVFSMQPTWRWAIQLHTGYESDAYIWSDGYHIPVELGTRARLSAHVDAGAAFGFTSLLGPINNAKDRMMFFDVAWRSE